MSAVRKLMADVAELGGRFYLAETGKVKVEAPAPLPPALVAMLRARRDEVAVALRREDVAPETPSARMRLDWWNAPVEGWREGRMTLRNIVSGKETVIYLPKKGTRH